MRRLLLAAALAPAIAGGPSLAEPGDYLTEVLPLMKEHCWNCHSNEKEVKGNLALEPETLSDQIGKYNIIRPGDPESSGFVERLKLDPNHADFMPRKAAPLSAREIEKIESWIRGGAIVDAKNPSEEEKARIAAAPPTSPDSKGSGFATWRNREGKAIEARLHSLSRDSARLVTRDGRSYDVPLSSLDDESRAQAEKLARSDFRGN